MTEYANITVTAEVDGQEKTLKIIPQITADWLEIKIQPAKQKRSLDANGYFWALADRLAAKLRTTKEEIYRQLILSVGVWDEVAIKEEAADTFCEVWERKGLGWIAIPVNSKLQGCKKVYCYRGTSTYTTAEMARLIDELVAECKANEVETLPPKEIEQLLREWK